MNERALDTIHAPDLRTRTERALRVAFVATWVTFAAAGILLACVNVNYGSPDSITNLQTARSIAAGRGFTSGIVAQLLVPQDMHREVLRSPGVPYLLAVLMRAFGESTAIQVLLNVFSVLLLAFALRSTLATFVSRWFGDLAGLFVLLGGQFELISIWNNNLLALVTGTVLWGAIGRGRIQASPRLLAFVVGCLAGFVCLLKATYALGVVPAAVFAVLSSSRSNKCRALVPLSIFALSAGIASAALWLPKLVDPDPFPYPIPAYTTAATKFCVYDLKADPPCNGGGIVRLKEPPSASSLLLKVIKERGWTYILKEYLRTCNRTLMWFVERGKGFVLLLALVGLLFVTKKNVRWVAVAGFLMVPPVAEGVLTHFEDWYLWPAWPLMLFLAGDTLHSWNLWAHSQVSEQLGRRVGIGMACMLSCAMVGCLLSTAFVWRSAFINARVEPSHEWVGAVRALPNDAVIISSDAWNVAWQGFRTGILSPDPDQTTPEDMQAVVDTYRAGYLLVQSKYPLRHFFAPEGLRRVFQGHEWTLFEILRPRAASPAHLQFNDVAR